MTARSSNASGYDPARFAFCELRYGQCTTSQTIGPSTDDCSSALGIDARSAERGATLAIETCTGRSAASTVMVDRRPLRVLDHGRGCAVNAASRKGASSGHGNPRARSAHVRRPEVWPASGLLGLDHLPWRASRLNGPAPKYAKESAPPSIDTFFRNMASCIWTIIGSDMAQKLCIMTVRDQKDHDDPGADAGAIAQKDTQASDERKDPGSRHGDAGERYAGVLRVRDLLQSQNGRRRPR